MNLASVSIWLDVSFWSCSKIHPEMMKNNTDFFCFLSSLVFTGGHSGCSLSAGGHCHHLHHHPHRCVEEGQWLHILSVCLRLSISIQHYWTGTPRCFSCRSHAMKSDGRWLNRSVWMGTSTSTSTPFTYPMTWPGRCHGTVWCWVRVGHSSPKESF